MFWIKTGLYDYSKSNDLKLDSINIFRPTSPLLVFVLQAKQRWHHQQPVGVCRVVGDCSAIKPSARTPTTATNNQQVTGKKTLLLNAPNVVGVASSLSCPKIGLH